MSILLLQSLSLEVKCQVREVLNKKANLQR